MMNSRFSKRYAVLGGIVALLFGVLRSLPYFDAGPDHTLLLSAARGVAVRQQLTGYGEAGLGDYAAGLLWSIGGASWLSWGQWLAALLGWALLAAAILVACWLILKILPGKKSRAALIGVLVILFLATGLPPAWRKITIRGNSEIALVAPVELAESVKQTAPGSVFANVSAMPDLLLFAPEAIKGLSAQDAQELAKESSAWRQALRQRRWSAVVLAGPLSEGKPLLDHLIGAPDWRLAKITNQGFLFLREPGLPANPPDPETLRLGNDSDAAVYLAQLALRLDAIRKTSEARACLARALKLDPKNVTVLSHAATFEVSRKHWQDAISYANQALQQDPGFVYAKLVKAMALLELQQADEAYQVTGEILTIAPNDSYTLFLHARICRTLHDYKNEAQTLEKLIKVENQNPVAVANYNIHLGQAYSRMGEAAPALKSYRAALTSGNLTKAQVEEVQQAVKTIESRVP